MSSSSVSRLLIGSIVVISKTLFVCLKFKTLNRLKCLLAITKLYYLHYLFCVFKRFFFWIKIKRIKPLVYFRNTKPTLVKLNSIYGLIMLNMSCIFSPLQCLILIRRLSPIEIICMSLLNIKWNGNSSRTISLWTGGTAIALALIVSLNVELLATTYSKFSNFNFNVTCVISNSTLWLSILICTSKL